jgi:hypothetical protein
MSLPAISSLIQAAVLGDLGEGTVQTEVRRCPVEWPYKAVTRFDYRFDFWNGEDLVETMGQYAVSDRLRLAMEEQGMRGVDFKEMTTSALPTFAISERAYSRTLPRFHWMIITGTAEGPPIWTTPVPCKGCGGISWNLFPAAFLASSWPLTPSQVPPMREVYRDSWRGEDVFYPGDHVLPLVTDRFVALLDRLASPVLLQPARWVDRE